MTAFWHNIQTWNFLPYRSICSNALPSMVNKPVSSLARFSRNKFDEIQLHRMAAKKRGLKTSTIGWISHWWNRCAPSWGVISLKERKKVQCSFVHVAWFLFFHSRNHWLNSFKANLKTMKNIAVVRNRIRLWCLNYWSTRCEWIFSYLRIKC